jgi:glucosamine-6-phosphate deaminase
MPAMARIAVFDTVDALAAAAADEAASVVQRAIDVDGVAHVMFATGNSQLVFLERLTGRGDMDWGRVVVFHMDEYVGMGENHPASFAGYIRRRIVDRVQPKEAHRLNGLADPGGECERYASLLRSHPLHLCCLGIGENGHLAFNDPPVADFADPLDVKVVELDDICRRQQVGEGHFTSVTDVPTHAVTVTIPALLRAGRLLAIVPEVRKASPVRAALEGPVTTTCPASILRTLDHVSIYLDRESASLLPGTREA